MKNEESKECYCYDEVYNSACEKHKSPSELYCELNRPSIDLGGLRGVMKRGFGNVTQNCHQVCRVCGKGGLCEHNQSDASIRPANVCTGFNFEGECNQGEKFSCGECVKPNTKAKGE